MRMLEGPFTYGSLKIKQVFEVENKNLLNQYTNKKDNVMTQINEWPNELVKNPILTKKIFNRGNSQSKQENYLDQNLDYPTEVYLFHGTKLRYVPSIIEHGFDLTRAIPGPNTPAIYMAESSEKADQYTTGGY